MYMNIFGRVFVSSEYFLSFLVCLYVFILSVYLSASFLVFSCLYVFILSVYLSASLLI